MDLTRVVSLLSVSGDWQWAGRKRWYEHSQLGHNQQTTKRRETLAKAEWMRPVCCDGLSRSVEKLFFTLHRSENQAWCLRVWWLISNEREKGKLRQRRHCASTIPDIKLSIILHLKAVSLKHWQCSGARWLKRFSWFSTLWRKSHWRFFLLSFKRK